MPAVENYVPPPGLNLKWLTGRLRAGVHTTLLIVCNSNYIRSPFSEYILRRAFAALPPTKLSLLRVTSGATVFDRKGTDGMQPHARDYLVQQEGFTRAEVDAHVPKYLKRPEHRHLMEEANVILAFEKTQLRTLPSKFRSKACLISQFVGGVENQVPDPMAEATPDVIARTFAQITPYLIAIIDAIKSA